MAGNSGGIWNVHTTRVRSNNSTGKNAALKKDGYARGPVPPSMIGTKVGKVDGEGYTGPNVAKP